jgi:hypothetical protein
MIAVRYDGQEVFYLGPKKGLPHPLKGRKVKKEAKIVPVEANDPNLNSAQNLLARAMNRSETNIIEILNNLK